MSSVSRYTAELIEAELLDIETEQEKLFDHLKGLEEAIKSTEARLRELAARRHTLRIDLGDVQASSGVKVRPPSE